MSERVDIVEKGSKERTEKNNGRRWRSDWP
jgi:hypothetical protein